MWLGGGGYEGYLEICTNTNTGTQWMPVWGGELWTDTDAILTECSPPCMNGGRCVYNNTCQCPPHWTGEHCEQNLLLTTYTYTHKDKTLPMNISTCHATCMNGGACSSHGNCVCMTGYDGLQCEHKKGIINKFIYCS